MMLLYFCSFEVIAWFDKTFKSSMRYDKAKREFIIIRDTDGRLIS